MEDCGFSGIDIFGAKASKEDACLFSPVPNNSLGDGIAGREELAVGFGAKEIGWVANVG